MRHIVRQKITRAAHPVALHGRAIVDEWLSLQNVVTAAPGERHWDVLRGVLADSQCRGPLVSDAVLPAVALE